MKITTRRAFRIRVSGLSVNTPPLIYDFNSACTLYYEKTSYNFFFSKYSIILKVSSLTAVYSLFPSPQSPRMWFSLSPPADPGGHTRPARSGKSWTCAGWRAAVSRSVPAQDPLRCGHKHRSGSDQRRGASGKISSQCNSPTRETIP